MKRTLITGARAILPTGIQEADVLIVGDSITDVGERLSASSDERVDASGYVLMPGVIDHHVHFREPGLTHKEDLATGSRACAAGGVTTFLEMPNTIPHAVDQAGIDHKLALAEGRSMVNYGFYIGATPDNVAALASAQRTPGIKIFIGSSTGELLVEKQETLERIFAETTLPICAHCEEESIRRENEARVRAECEREGRAMRVHDHSRIRDVRCALACTKRAVDLATRHRHPFHVLHVSTADEVHLLRTAPDWVTAEACHHHLHLTIDDYDRLGTRIQMNPSVKSEADRAALWAGLHEGVIGMVATDHAPHTLEEKARAYPDSPSGLPAVENALALLLHEVNAGRCTLEQVSRWTSANPAEVWGIANKGRIEPGYDADLVLVDMRAERTIRDAEQHTKCKWSPWDGVTLKGWPVRTWVMGEEVMRDGMVRDDPAGREARFARD